MTPSTEHCGAWPVTIDFLPLATTQDVKEQSPAVAILPIGSFEQHGPYLPLITDTLIASIIAHAIAREYPVLHLPPITVSCSHEHKSWPGTVSISARTLHVIVTDIHNSLARAGVPKLILINGHGGNYILRNVVQEASEHGPSMALFPSSSDWERARNAGEMITNNHDDMHAGELETSILLYACPQVAHNGYQNSDNLADNRPDLLTLGMTAYTLTGIIGRPSVASAAKGKVAITSLVESFAHYLAMLEGQVTSGLNSGVGPLLSLAARPQQQRWAVAVVPGGAGRFADGLEEAVQRPVARGAVPARRVAAFLAESLDVAARRRADV